MCYEDTMNTPRLITEHIATGKEDPDYPVTWIIKWTIHESYANVRAYEAPYSDRGLEPDVGVEEPVIDATIHWNGCADWSREHVFSAHTCCGNDVQNLAELLLYLYKRAGELIPDADEPWGD